MINVSRYCSFTLKVGKAGPGTTDSRVAAYLHQNHNGQIGRWQATERQLITVYATFLRLTWISIELTV